MIITVTPERISCFNTHDNGIKGMEKITRIYLYKKYKRRDFWQRVLVIDWWAPAEKRKKNEIKSSAFTLQLAGRSCGKSPTERRRNTLHSIVNNLWLLD